MPRKVAAPESLGICRNCGQREATIKWVGDGGSLGFVHGHWVPWCERCMVEAQLRYARERAADIPDLEARLETLL